MAIRKILSLLRGLVLDSDEQAFVRHNRAFWKGPVPEPNGEILIEETVFASTIIAVSYVANVLAQKYRSSITVYSGKRSLFLPRSVRRIYQSFGSRFLFYSDHTVQKVVEVLFEDVYPKIKSKRDVEQLAIDGVPIGDLVYDTHLRKYLIPTIDIASEEFKQTLRESLCLYLYWEGYFKQHTVKAVIVSHCVYSWNAIILRVAVHQSIPVYQATAQGLYYITESHNYRAYNEFIDYPKSFQEMDNQEKRAAYAEAESRLALRFAGHVGVDMHYSKKSAYTPVVNEKRIVAESPRIKMLIATHCFFDSPHPYGNNLFPDFYEWLTFLGEISERTNYDWYIKTHPDFLPGNLEVIDGFLGKYSKFNLIPSDTSHHQLIKEGIDFALTVYGTIGFEYAAQGVTVINASICNPHIAYDFNLHPETVKEYEQILLNCESQKIHIEDNKVYEYYYCRFINQFDNWIYKDYDSFILKIGGYSQQAGSISYRQFLDEFSTIRNEEIIGALEKFIESNDYCLAYKHTRPAS